jgi:hypothetical protein
VVRIPRLSLTEIDTFPEELGTDALIRPLFTISKDVFWVPNKKADVLERYPPSRETVLLGGEIPGVTEDIKVF